MLRKFVMFSWIAVAKNSNNIFYIKNVPHKHSESQIVCIQDDAPRFVGSYLGPNCFERSAVAFIFSR